MQCCVQFYLRCTGQACCLDVSADVADTIANHLLPEPNLVLAGMEMLVQLVTDEATSKQVGHGCWADAALASLSKVGTGEVRLYSMNSGVLADPGIKFAGERAGCRMKGMASVLLQRQPAVLTAAVCNIAHTAPP